MVQNKLIVMTDEDWIEKFRPIMNHIDETAVCEGFDPENPEKGCMFETFGADLAYIQAVLEGRVPGLSERNVWTWMDAELPGKDEPNGKKLKAKGWKFRDGDWIKGNVRLGDGFIGDGYHYVNRIGYFVTRVPAEVAHYSIYGDDVLVEIYKEAA